MRKKRKIIFLAVAVGVLIGLTYGVLRTVTGEEFGKNLLKNGNFEMVDSSGKIKSWKEDPKGGWSISTKDSFDGERYVQATVGWSWLSQDVRVKPERYYLLKAYVRSDITIPGKVQAEDTFLTLECLDWQGSLIERDYGIVSAASSWEEKIRQIYAPKGTKKMRVKLAKRQGKGSVWFDKLELKQVPSSSVLNPNFEMLDKLGGPKYWKEDPRGGWSISLEEPFEGERYMQATVGWSWLSQEIPVESEKYYVLKVYVRSDIAIPGKANYGNTFLGVDYLDKEARIIKENFEMVNAAFSWQQKILQIYTPKGTKKLRVKLAKRQGEGSVWFDGVKLEAFSPPLLYNSSFEMVDGLGRADYWREDSKGGWSSTTEEPFEGERSMRATVGWSWLSQEILAKPGRNYTLKGYVRSDIVFTGGEEDWNAFLALQCLNEKKEVIAERIRQLNAARLWMPQGVSVYAPEHTKKIRVKLAKRKGGGSVWFDEFKIIESPWYMRIGFLRRILQDKPFFIFYFSIYFILLVALLRVILKKRPF